MIDDIVAILKADSDVNDNVNEVYSVEPDQSEQLPFIVITEDQTTTNDTKDGPSTLDQIRITVSCRALLYHTVDTTIGAHEISEYVRTALDHYSTSPYFIRLEDQRTIDNRLSNKPSYEKEMEFEVTETR
ncbi:MAG: DUF3168 domain-containing protein [bacterium]|nr:DUF3168 domain-containing protein [bacterium]